MNAVFKTAVTLAALIIVGVLAVAAWQFGWFVEAKNTDRRTQVVDQSLGRQQALQGQVLRQIAEVRSIDTQEPTEANAAQRIAIVDSLCINAGMLTGSLTLPASAETFINQECPA